MVGENPKKRLIGAGLRCRGCYIEQTNRAGLKCAVPCFGVGEGCATGLECECFPRLDECTVL